MDSTDKTIVKWATRAAFAVLCVLGLACSCTSVPTGNVGVVKYFGAVQPYTLGEGVSFTRPWPFADVIEISTQNNTTDTEAASASM